MESSQIVRQAWLVLEPQLAELGFELVEVEYAGSFGGRVLRIFMDKPDSGITLEDCSRAARVLSPVLDLEDFVPEEYTLEVSSPGIDRPVRKAADFMRFIGEEIQIVTHAPVEGRKRFHGKLSGFQDEMIEVECEGARFSIHLENLKKANLNR